MKKLSLITILFLSLLLLVSGCRGKEELFPEGSSQVEEGELSEEKESVEATEETSKECEEESESAEQGESAVEKPMNGSSDPADSGNGSSTGVSSTIFPGDISQTVASTTASSQNTQTQPVHVHGYETTVWEPTCKSQGYTRYACACGDYYYDNYLAKLEHAYGEWQVMVAPTYTEEGVQEKVCSQCGDTIRGIIRQLVNISVELDAIVTLVNKERAAAGLEPVSVRTDLQNLAAERAVEIASMFSHDRPAGKESLAVILGGSGYKIVCENIAKGYRSAEQVMTGWMNSAGHRQNILMSSVRYIGVGCYYTEENGGMYCWVQVFGG